MIQRTIKIALTGAAVTLALMATGCTPTPASPAPAAVSRTSVPTISPEPDASGPVTEPGEAELVLPECETLLPLAAARSAFGSGTEFFQESVATEFFTWYDSAQVNAAIHGASVARACWWGVPSSDGAFSLLVAKVDPTTRGSIEAALDAQGFSSTTMGTVTTLESGREGELSYEAETHLFTGDVWILALDGGLDVTGAVAGSALDAMRSANPARGY